MRNAEYRLCLEKNLDINEVNHESPTPESSKFDLQEMLHSSDKIDEQSGKNDFSSKLEKTIDDPSEDIGIKGLGEMSPEVQQYIHHLQSRLSSAKKVLHSGDPPFGRRNYGFFFFFG